MTRTMLCAALAALAACGEDGPDETDGGPVDGGGAGVVEPDLSRACVGTEDPECPAHLLCLAEIGCVPEGECPSAGPGADHGCPANGFCYTIDGAPTGMCRLICETDADCTNVNAALTRCTERSSTEAWGLKVCLTESGS